jgi:hypothetical protein
MKFILTTLFALSLLFNYSSAPLISQAVRSPDAELPDRGTIPIDTGVSESTSLITTISIIINWALGFIGIVIFIIFLFAGFEYATAGGDQGKAESAQKRITNAIIGLIIIFFVFVASNTILGFVFQDANSSSFITNSIYI